MYFGIFEVGIKQEKQKISGIAQVLLQNLCIEEKRK
jgi:hypothetical protein